MYVCIYIYLSMYSRVKDVRTNARVSAAEARKEQIPLLYNDTVQVFNPSSGNVTTVTGSTLINYQINLASNQCLVSLQPEIYNVTANATSTSAGIASLGAFATVRLSDQSSNEIFYCSQQSNALANIMFNLDQGGGTEVLKAHSQSGANFACVSSADQSPQYSSASDVSSVRFATLGPGELYIPAGTLTGNLSVDIQGRNNVVNSPINPGAASVCGGARLIAKIRQYNQPIPRPKVVFARCREFFFPAVSVTAGSALQLSCPINSQVLGFFFSFATAGRNYLVGDKNLSTLGTGLCELNTSSGSRLINQPLSAMRNESLVSNIYVYGSQFMPTKHWASSAEGDTEMIHNWVDTGLLTITPDNSALSATSCDVTVVFLTQEIITPVGQTGVSVAPVKF